MNRWLLLILTSLLVTGFLIFPIRGTTHDSRTGVLRLRGRVKGGEATKGFSRKRFFLLPGALEQHRSLLEGILQRPVLTRDCYYSKLGASKALINWLMNEAAAS